VPQEDLSNCLFTVRQVSQALKGSWERYEDGERPCGYMSDRGARFATYVVDQASKRGLQAARDACAAGVEPMKAAGEGFVCVEQRKSGDLVVGNTVARGQLWIAVIAPSSGGTHHAERAAMLALMDAVPTER
jgi:hypothetical protein